MGVTELVMCHISECSADLRVVPHLGLRAPDDCVHVCMNMSLNSIDEIHMSFTVLKDKSMLLYNICSSADPFSNICEPRMRGRGSESDWRLHCVLGWGVGKGAKWAAPHGHSHCRQSLAARYHPALCFNGKLADNSSHESDVTSLQDPFMSLSKIQA